MTKVASAVLFVQTPVAVNLGDLTQVVVAASVLVPLSSVMDRVNTPSVPLVVTVSVPPAFNLKEAVLTVLPALSLMAYVYAADISPPLLVIVNVASAVSAVQTPITVNLGNLTQVVVAALVVVPLSSVMDKVRTPSVPLVVTVSVPPAFNVKEAVLTVLPALSLTVYV